MATYSKRGRGYSVRWRDPGGQNPRRYQVPDLNTAKELAAEAAGCEARGVPWIPPKERVAAVSVQLLDDLAVAWLADKKRTAARATINAYTDNVERFIDFVHARVGCRPTLAHFTRGEVQAFDRAMLDRGLAVSTRRSRVAAVKTWAGWLEAEHPEHFRAAPIKAVAMPRAPEPSVLALSWGEVDATIAHMGGEGHVAATIARCTGLRRGEVVALRWRDLIPATGGGLLLRIRSEITKGGRSGRVVPVAPVLADYLATHRKSIDEAPLSDSRIVSIRDDSFGVMVASAIRAAVADGTCRADALSVHSSTHLFRKAFITNLRRAKADADAVEHLVGHKLSGVRGCYLDLDDLMLAAVALVPPVRSLAAIR